MAISTKQLQQHLDFKDVKGLIVVDSREHLTRADCIRSHIPKLRVYDVCGFEVSDDVLATMLCFHLDRHDSISNIKSIAFSSSDVHTLVEKEDRRASSVDLENFIRKRNFEVNQRILAENIKHSLAAEEMQSSVDLSKVSTLESR